MEGTVAASKLIGRQRAIRRDGVRFEIATHAHDAQIRRLLRETPMAGDISVTMEREPNYFAAAEMDGSEHRAIVALHNDRVIGVGGVSVRLRFVNGEPVRVGYLSGLRLAERFRGQALIVRRGYALLR